MSCKYNNCKHCGYKSECEIFKENAELKSKLRDKKCYDKDCPVFIKLVQAQKENAELKETVTKMNNVITETFSKLTNAKEIIKGLLSFVDSLGNFSGGIFTKAEQFISEVEK